MISRHALLQRFFVAAMSGWIASPLGILYLQFIGWGENDTVTCILLALSAVFPIQLLLNEYLATEKAIYNYKLSAHFLLFLYFLSLFIALIGLFNWRNIFGDFIEPLDFLISLLTAISILLSFDVSARLYRSILANTSQLHHSFVIGSTPGLVLLICFIIAGSTNNRDLLLLAAILPAVSQYIITILICPTDFKNRSTEGIRLNFIPILILTSALIIIGWGSAGLRAGLASYFPHFANLIIIALNLLGTLAMLVTRAIYMAGNSVKPNRLLTLTMGILISALIVSFFSQTTGMIIGIIAAQMAAVTTINWLRRPTTPRSTKNGPFDYG